MIGPDSGNEGQGFIDGRKRSDAAGAHLQPLGQGPVWLHPFDGPEEVDDAPVLRTSRGLASPPSSCCAGAAWAPLVIPWYTAPFQGFLALWHGGATAFTLPVLILIRPWCTTNIMMGLVLCRRTEAVGRSKSFLY